MRHTIGIICVGSACLLLLLTWELIRLPKRGLELLLWGG